MTHRFQFATLILFFAGTAILRASDAQPPAGLSAEQRGYWFLTQKAYLPPDFSQEVFDNVWKKWPEPLRTQAEKASPDERR